ncbi:ABC-type amino acid transport substrate-binding protein [Ewingella americana]
MLKVLFVLLLTLSMSVLAAAPPQQLMIYSRQPQPELKFQLSDADWRWLGIKKELTVATWEPQNQPMDIVVAPATFEGISADYLQIVSRQLGVQPRPVRFNSRTEALMAVESGQVDMMIDDHGSPDIDLKRFAASVSYLPNHPALVTKEVNGMDKPAPGKPFSLVVAKDYLSDAQIKKLYPDALITRFPSSQSAISALAYRHYDYLLGNMANVSFFIDRNYSNSLSVVSVSPRSRRRGALCDAQRQRRAIARGEQRAGRRHPAATGRHHQLMVPRAGLLLPAPTGENDAPRAAVDQRKSGH